MQYEKIPSQEKLKRGGQFIERIEEGDIIGVGGTLGAESSSYFMKVTADNLEKYRSDCQEVAGSINFENMKDWLKENNIQVPPELYLRLWAISIRFQPLTAKNPERADLRKQKYLNSRGEPLDIQELVSENIAECAEVSALCQLILQDNASLKATYVGGDLLADKEWEFSEEHAFELVEHNGELYIFDVSRPMRFDWGVAPRVYKAPNNFVDLIQNGGPQTFVECKSCYAENQSSFYGVNNQNNIRQENLIFQKEN